MIPHHAVCWGFHSSTDEYRWRCTDISGHHSLSIVAMCCTVFPGCIRVYVHVFAVSEFGSSEPDSWMETCSLPVCSSSWWGGEISGMLSQAERTWPGWGQQPCPLTALHHGEKIRELERQKEEEITNKALNMLPFHPTPLSLLPSLHLFLPLSSPALLSHWLPRSLRASFQPTLLPYQTPGVSKFIQTESVSARHQGNKQWGFSSCSIRAHGPLNSGWLTRPSYCGCIMK